MQRDGFDPKIMDLDFNKSVVSQSKKIDASPLLEKDPPNLAKLRTNLKVSSLNF
jgi:hypothetical protein